MPDTPVPDKPELSPEQAREVRRLLADARHTEPMPEDVAVRLDGVLAGLAHQRPAVDEPDPADPGAVVALASRRRRRVTAMLAAAAAVVAVGVGVDQLAQQLAQQGGSASDSAPSADRGESGPGESGAGSAPQREHSATSSNGLLAPTDGGYQRVRELHFAADVRQVRRAAREPVAADSPVAGSACSPRDRGAGKKVLVRYQGRTGLLVFRAVRGDTQVVDLYGCGSSEVLRSITLPAP